MRIQRSPACVSLQVNRPTTSNRLSIPLISKLKAVSIKRVVDSPLCCIHKFSCDPSGSPILSFLSLQKMDEGAGCMSSLETKQVALMRALVEAQDPAAKAEDDLTLRRFLRARDLDIEKGATMFLKYLNWRRVAVPNGFISKTEIQNELAQKKCVMQGFDKQQRPIVIFFGVRHYYAKRDMDDFKRFVVHVLDSQCSRMSNGQEKFACIADMQGWGYSNCDIRAYLAGLDIMQSYYPERLGKVLLIHVPYMFMKAWKIIYPFIDKNTRKKFVFVEDKSLKATLLEDIDESQLLEIYGGKLSECPSEDPSN